MRKAATVRNTQVTLNSEKTYGVSDGKETKRSHRRTFHEPRTATKQDLLNVKIQKLAMKIDNIERTFAEILPENAVCPSQFSDA